MFPFPKVRAYPSPLYVGEECHTSRKNSTSAFSFFNNNVDHNNTPQEIPPNMHPDGFTEYYNHLSTSASFSPIDLRLQTHSLAPYKPNSPSPKSPPTPPPFGVFKSTRSSTPLTWTQRFNSKPTNSTYHLIHQNHHLQHLRPSPHNHAFQYQPSYDIHHHTSPSPSGKHHDVAIQRSSNDDKSGSGGVAVINHIQYTLTTHITYSKTGLTQNLLSDFTCHGDLSAEVGIFPRDYRVRVNREECIWKSLGLSSSLVRVSNMDSNKDGTMIGVLELRSVVDGKLCATVGSEWVGGGSETETKRCVMVRGEWGPGSGVCVAFSVGAWFFLIIHFYTSLFHHLFLSPSSPLFLPHS